MLSGAVFVSEQIILKIETLDWERKLLESIILI